MNSVVWSPRDRCWESSYVFVYRLKNPIKDVTLYTKALYLFLKKVGLPFPYLEMKYFFEDKTMEPNKRPYWKHGFVVIKVKEPSLLSRINPFHDELRGDETIVIQFKHNDRYFRAWHEITSFANVRWKLKEKELLRFMELLDSFSKKTDLELTLLLTSEEEKNG